MKYERVNDLFRVVIRYLTIRVKNLILSYIFLRTTIKMRLSYVQSKILHLEKRKINCFETIVARSIFKNPLSEFSRYI